MCLVITTNFLGFKCSFVNPKEEQCEWNLTISDVDGPVKMIQKINNQELPHSIEPEKQTENLKAIVYNTQLKKEITVEIINTPIVSKEVIRFFVKLFKSLQIITVLSAGGLVGRWSLGLKNGKISISLVALSILSTLAAYFCAQVVSLVAAQLFISMITQTLDKMKSNEEEKLQISYERKVLKFENFGLSGKAIEFLARNMKHRK